MGSNGEHIPTNHGSGTPPFSRLYPSIEVQDQMAATTSENSNETASDFRKLWQIAAADDNMTMYGFRRFKTSHLLNLRFLEHETELLDRDIYQAGLKLGFPTSSTDRLGLERSVKDENAKDASEVITSDSVVRLRKLIQEYGMFLLQ